MRKNFNLQTLVGGMIHLLLFPMILFPTAGTLKWPAAWIFLVLFYGDIAITARLLSNHHPGLLKERLSVFKQQEPLFFLLSAVALICPYIW